MAGRRPITRFDPEDERPLSDKDGSFASRPRGCTACAIHCQAQQSVSPPGVLVLERSSFLCEGSARVL